MPDHDGRCAFFNHFLIYVAVRLHPFFFGLLVYRRTKMCVALVYALTGKVLTARHHQAVLFYAFRVCPRHFYNVFGLVGNNANIRFRTAEIQVQIHNGRKRPMHAVLTANFRRDLPCLFDKRRLVARAPSHRIRKIPRALYRRFRSVFHVGCNDNGNLRVFIRHFCVHGDFFPAHICKEQSARTNFFDNFFHFFGVVLVVNIVTKHLPHQIFQGKPI